MKNLWQENISLIETRWPDLARRLIACDVAGVAAELREGRMSTLTVNGVQLGSRHDREAEASLQAASLPDAPMVNLYGTGLGDLPRAFLRRSGLQHLEARLLNEEIFALVLHLLDQTDWLADTRVNLALAADDPQVRLPYFASPPELVLASDLNAKVRDRLVADIGVNFSNSRFEQEAPELIERLEKNLPLVRGDSDVSELFGTRIEGEAIVVGAGPSLDRCYSALKNIRSESPDTLFIAVDTALRSLLDQDICPDIVVSVDQLTTAKTLCLERSRGIDLVYFPMLDPAVLGGWLGRRYVAYGQAKRYDDLSQRVARTALYCDGSVLHAAVDLAVRMCVGRVTLVGADFAYVDGRSHAGWAPGELSPHIASPHWVLNGYGEKVTTLLNLRAYLCSLERYIANHGEVMFSNASKAGALIDGVEYDPRFVG